MDFREKLTVVRLMERMIPDKTTSNLKLNNRGRVFLTLLSSSFCLFSLPGNPFPLLAVICFVPLGVALHGASRKTAMLYGFMFGFIGWLGSTYGLAVGFSSYVKLNPVEVFLYMLAFCFYLAIPYGLFGLLYGIFQWMDSPLGPLKTSACLTILISILPSPIPIAPAHSLYVFPLYTQILDIGGESLLLFILLLVNWLLVDFILRLRNRKSLKPNLIALTLITASITSYGYFRLDQHRRNESKGDRTQVMTVAGIQPNIPLPEQQPFSADRTGLILSTLLHMSEQALSKNTNVDLIVWPEIPGKVDCERNSGFNRRLLTFARYHRTPLLVNCEQSGTDGGKYNTALLIVPDGTIASYHKQRLFPFAEYLPGEHAFPVLRKIMPGVSRYQSGQDTVVFRVKRKGFVFVPICYEILFAGHIGIFIKKGGNLLVNPTNDAWFGSSRIPDFLIAACVYQSIQYRIPAVRISNSGNSLFIKSSGEWVAGTKTAAFAKAITVASVYLPANRSPYTYLGDIFLYLLILIWSISLYFDTSQIRKAQNVKSEICKGI